MDEKSKALTTSRKKHEKQLQTINDISTNNQQEIWFCVRIKASKLWKTIVDPSRNQSFLSHPHPTKQVFEFSLLEAPSINITREV
jgi:hypothetical protein